MLTIVLMNVKGVVGSCRRTAYRNWIEVESLSQSGGLPGTSFDVTVMTGITSAKFFDLCAKGKEIPLITMVAIYGGSNRVTWRYEWTDVVVSSFQTGGYSGGGSIDSISFEATEVKRIYYG
jgi:type VI protein secretion system component Hcp